MNQRVAFPFLTLSDRTITATPWSLSLDGNAWTDIKEHLLGWDASSTIRLRRSFSLNPQLAAEDLCSSADDLELKMTVQIGTGQGRLPRLIVERHSYTLKPGSWGHELELLIPHGRLSFVLDLLTEVKLARPASSAAPLAPCKVGDRLWTERTRSYLEGEEPRFPIEIADLANLTGDNFVSSAPWHLHWSPRDWERDFHSAIRLYLDEKATEFLERIESQDQLTLQIMLADVISQICERFLLDTEAEEMIISSEPGSLGAQAARWLRTAWPGKNAAFIRSLLESQPGVFRSSLMTLAVLPEE